MGEPTEQQKGYLDGWLMLDPISDTEAYASGYLHGLEARTLRDDARQDAARH